MALPSRFLDKNKFISSHPDAVLVAMQALKSFKIAFHTILLGVGGSIYTSNTLHHLKELGLNSPGIIGNEHANALAIMSATTYADIADTSIRTAGPEGNTFYNIHWLAKEDIENQTQTHNHTHTTNMAHSPPPKLWYLPNHRDALQAHMHLLHKLGNAKTEANYHAYYQTLIKDGTANGATSNAYLTSSDVPFKTKCITMKYRTGTLYNQKHAVLFKLSTSQT